MQSEYFDGGVKDDEPARALDRNRGCPIDRERMLHIVRTFLAMKPERQMVYQVGRRLGYFSSLNDMERPQRLAKAEKMCRELGITPDNVDDVIDELMKRFI